MRPAPGGGADFEPLEKQDTVRGLPRTSDLVVKFILDDEDNNEQIVLVTATIGGSLVGIYGTGTLTIPKEDLTDNITITANTQPLPTGVTMGQYNKDTNTPEGAGTTILDAFDGYKYLTLNNAEGDYANKRWIIIGAHGLFLGNNVGDPKNELGSGQVLLLSETVLENHVYDNGTHNMSNWSTSEIRAYLNGISIEGNDGTTNYQDEGFYQNSRLKEKYGGRIIPQGLKTAWNTSSSHSNPVIEFSETGVGEVPADNIFLLATTRKRYLDFDKQDFCAQTYLGDAYLSGEEPPRNGKWIAKNNGGTEDVGWWLRSGEKTTAKRQAAYYYTGTETSQQDVAYMVITGSEGVRPAFVSDMKIRATVTLHNGDVTPSQTEVIATYGSPMPAITPPTKTGFTFGGYYTKQGETYLTKYYNADGTSARNSDFTTDTTLYAKWNVTVSLQGGNCTIKSINGNANNTTAVQAGADATIVVEADSNYVLYRACTIKVGGSDLTSPPSYDGNGTLTIPGESITGNITITSTTKKLPNGVHLGTCDPNGAFNGYKYLTFDGVTNEASGNWIIIGADADDLCLGNNVGDPKNELGSGQVLLLREKVWTEVTDFYGHNANWEDYSTVRSRCQECYNKTNGLHKYAVVLQKNLVTYYAGGSCEPDDSIFLLARGIKPAGVTEEEKFAVTTYLGSERDAKLQSAARWWLRSGDISTENFAVYVDSYGNFVSELSTVNRNHGFRPAFVLQI